jgi:putative inorganic carbon (HCO3(-)) transporter
VPSLTARTLRLPVSKSGTLVRNALSAGKPSARWSREWFYFALVIISWCFTPLMRRLIDYHAGAFNPIQITSLIPFFMLLPLAFVALRKSRLERLSRTFRVLAYIWIGTFLYGFVIAAAIGTLSAAAFELVQYLVPMLAGIWLAGQSLPVMTVLKRTGVIILACAAIVAIYGVAQWVQPPPWDVMWVQGSDFVSAGPPTPFAMRVFATLNSPGPAGDFFALTMILAIPLLRFGRVWTWPLLAALGAALLLSMIREAWVGLIVGTFVYLIASPRRLATIPPLAVYAVLVMFLVSSLPALLGSGVNADVITSRIATLGDVSHDDSALTRQNEISDALTQGLANPLGQGLGAVGAAAKLGFNVSAVGNVLDSGYLARLLELGWFGTLAYLSVVIGGPLVLAYALMRPASLASVDAKVAGATAIAMCAALAWSDAANDSHLGLDGLFFWIALGLGSLAIQSCAAPARLTSRTNSLQRAR